MAHCECSWLLICLIVIKLLAFKMTFLFQNHAEPLQILTYILADLLSFTFLTIGFLYLLRFWRRKLLPSRCIRIVPLLLKISFSAAFTSASYSTSFNLLLQYRIIFNYHQLNVILLASKWLDVVGLAILERSVTWFLNKACHRQSDWDPTGLKPPYKNLKNPKDSNYRVRKPLSWMSEGYGNMFQRERLVRKPPVMVEMAYPSPWGDSYQGGSAGGAQESVPPAVATRESEQSAYSTQEAHRVLQTLANFTYPNQSASLLSYRHREFQIFLDEDPEERNIQDFVVGVLALEKRTQ